MARESFRCVHRLRVRWAEVDMQKVVFNAHYLTYVDSAIAEYWREIGLAYPETYIARFGSDMFLRRATVEYLNAARYDDELLVLCRVGKLGRTSMTFAFDLLREGEHAGLLVKAELVYVNVDVKTMKPHPLPDELKTRVREYERLAPVED